MPNPTINSVHINRPLTNISIAWRQSQIDFVADRVFPIIPVSKQSDLYYVYDRSYWYRSEMQLRAPGTESAGGGFKVTTDNYYCPVYALHKDIDDQIRSNEDAPLSLERDSVEWLNLQAMIKKEQLFATSFLTGGVWSYEYDGVSSSPTATSSLDPTSDANNNVLQWNDASSTPIEDIRRAKTYVKEKTGYMPNILTIGQKVYDALVDHPDVIDRIKFGQTPGAPAMAGREVLAKLFEVDEVNIASGVNNTAAEGATEANSFIVGKHALLTYRPPRPSILTPSAGYTFGWTGYLGGGVGAFQISKFRMEHLKSDRVEGELAYAQKKVAGDLGFFFDGIVA